jgi:ribosomal protein S18 acetylase RimI-like enzyme
MEILYRGPKRLPEIEVNYWVSQGFNRHLQRDCYALPVSELNEIRSAPLSEKVSIRLGSGESDIRYVKEAIEGDLDYYTGDILSYKDIESYCVSGDVLIVSVDGHPAGFIQANLKNKVYWLEHIVVDAEHRGLGLSKILMEAYFIQGLEKKCRSFQLWVIDKNKAAVHLYRKYGFKYLNKSTLSLLNKKNGKNT